MKIITLNNGIEMPLLGYGVYLVDPKECEHHVLEAIGMGYRLIDTAQVYHNEEGVGNAMLKCGVPREELFITTKIWVSNAGEKKAADSIEESLRKLRTDYVDLLLIHQPFGDYPGTWRAMERAVKEGKARAIGLSNFYADRFVDLALYANIKPAINQLMTNVFTQRWEEEREMKPYGTRLMAWGPLAQGKENLAACPQLASLAEKYGRPRSKWPCATCWSGTSSPSPRARTLTACGKTWTCSTSRSPGRRWKACARWTSPYPSAVPTATPRR